MADQVLCYIVGAITWGAILFVMFADLDGRSKDRPNKRRRNPR